MLFLLGLAVSAGLHGLYDWTVNRSLLAAASIVWMSFLIFYALCARPRIVSISDGLQFQGDLNFRDKREITIAVRRFYGDCRRYCRNFSVARVSLSRDLAAKIGAIAKRLSPNLKLTELLVA